MRCENQKHKKKWIKKTKERSKQLPGSPTAAYNSEECWDAVRWTLQSWSGCALVGIAGSSRFKVHL